VITEDEKQIYIEETPNIEIKDKMIRANKIVEIFVNIEQVFSPQTNKNHNTMMSVTSGKVDEQVKGLSDTVVDANPYPFTDNDRWNVVNKRWRSRTSKFVLSKISAAVIIQIQEFTSKYAKKKVII
jgi:hypothetical protein